MKIRQNPDERLTGSEKARLCPYPLKCDYEESLIEDYLGQQIKRSVLEHRKDKVRLLTRTFQILFPGMRMSLQQSLFEAYWEMKKYRRAIQIYRKMKAPFWCAGKVGAYYERSGQMKDAMLEYERLVEAYYKMDILPLPRGPVELFKLGKWYAIKNPSKARKYLRTYLNAATGRTGGSNYVRHKKQAAAILRSLSPEGALSCSLACRDDLV
jgi:hypothetical protein